MSSRRPSLSSISSSSRAERTSVLEAMKKFGDRSNEKYADTENSKQAKEIQKGLAKQQLDLLFQMQKDGRLEENCHYTSALFGIGLKAAYKAGWEEGFSHLFTMDAQFMRKMKAKQFKEEVERLEKLVKRMKQVTDVLGTEYGGDDDSLATILSTKTEQVVLGGLALARVLEMGYEGDGWEDRKYIDRWIEKGRAQEDRKMGSLWFLFQTIGRSFRENRQVVGGY